MARPARLAEFERDEELAALTLRGARYSTDLPEPGRYGAHNPAPCHTGPAARVCAACADLPPERTPR